MSPSDFTFKLTVPTDPEGASVVAVVAAHAVEYAKIDKAAGTPFIDKVRGLAASSLAGAKNGKSGSHCLVVFAAANGQLTVTIGTDSVSHPLP
jgi:hypothetical protein